MNIFYKKIEGERVYFSVLNKEAGWFAKIEGKLYGLVGKVLNTKEEALAIMIMNAEETIKELKNPTDETKDTVHKK